MDDHFCAMTSVFDISQHGAKFKQTQATVILKEGYASITFNGDTIRIPWEEIARWQQWLDENVEEKAWKTSRN